ncbi:MAG TPA: polyphosphate kinase 1 [Blastocatellia bacterium]|nr:polyphosphate kinase 1 [Blastocatellia bacterium]
MSDPIKSQLKERNLAVARNVPLPQTLFLQRELQFNRESSWLEFNRRVLEEAMDASNPLLERLNFLTIFSSNLDEFFMIRVSGLKQQIEAGVTELSPDGMSPGAQLREISEKLRPMIAAQTRCLNQEILAELANRGLVVAPYRALSDRERRSLNAYFIDNVFPILTPLAVDPGHPFPYISNLSLNLGVMVSAPDAGTGTEPRFARIKVPPIVPRLVPVDSSNTEFTLLEELVAANIDTLFPGLTVGDCHVFRVTRDADIEIREDEAGDLLRMIEQQLHNRRFGSCVRLEVDGSMPGEMVRYLAGSTGLSAQDVYTIDGPLDLSGLRALGAMERPELRYRPFTRRVPATFSTGESVFDVIKSQDVLVHHPYDSFSPVTDFIQTAAADPDVVAIKMTLYRAGPNSPIVQALMDACEKGKQVAALVELKARFDEENNIEWARRLERSGVHVVYGLVGLKTHSKICLVVRREAGTLRRYVHVGTGNYNPITARIYEDIGLFTSNDMIGADATDLFNFLTGFSRQSQYRRMLVAPLTLRDKLLALIEREVEHQKAGRPAGIIAKLNHITDTKMIRALYEASQGDVKIDLFVRGICTLRPGVPGLSSTISVTSVVGRFLEHSRILCFANGGDEEIFIGSADWMYRNLERRVELMVPIDDPRLRKYIKEEMLSAYIKDNLRARVLRHDGSYERLRPAAPAEGFDVQAYFVSGTNLSEAQAAESRR